MFNKGIIVATLSLLSFILLKCVNASTYAPVSELSSFEPLPTSGIYRVQPNDTLYSIAWRFGLDYRDIIKINNISKSYHIETGQLLYLKKHNLQKAVCSEVVTANSKTGSVKSKQSVPETTSHKSALSVQRWMPRPSVQEKQEPKPPIRETVAAHSSFSAPEKRGSKPGLSVQEKTIDDPSLAHVTHWVWPIQGTVVTPFSSNNKGINISGSNGETIVAAAPGVVVYSGDDLKAYGNLIIIKHNPELLSAYAYNAKIFVKEGDWVKTSQRIAEMGLHSKKWTLHFEIRQNGKPVNPLSYLPRR